MEANLFSLQESLLRGVAGRLLLGVLWCLFLAAMPTRAEPLSAGFETDAVQLLPVPQPDLTRLEGDVRHALERARRELDGRLESADTGELAELFGNAGLLYQAHLILEPAAFCYQNAQRLMPDDYRWPYYLAYVHQQAGHLELAAVAYERALELEPTLATARLRLGRILLELDRTERAEPLLLEAAKQPGLQGAALFDLGRLAYARRDYALARDRLLAALEASPGATRIHYTLALAYRGLGDLEAARRHLALHGEREPDFPDPLIDLMAGLSTGQRMLFHYGMNAAHRREYPLAVRFFREGLAFDPDNVKARVSLARFLYLSGDGEAARRQLEQALETSPDELLARFFLAVLQESAGEDASAVAGLRRVLELDPLHPGAHFYLAGALMRRGDYAAAARHYGLTLERSPDNGSAVFWRISASILAGLSHPELRKLLEAAHQRRPEDPAVGYFLAALLAASPDAAVRDTPRAMQLAQSLQSHHDSLEHRELLAMAYAGNGDFEQAVAWQKQAVSTAYQGFRFDLLPRLDANLERYRNRQPCPEPWSSAQLLRVLPRNNVRKAFQAYPPEAAF